MDVGEIARVFQSRSARYLGGGTYGESWLIDGTSGPRVAKILLDPNFQRSPRLLREIESLKRAESEHVVRLVDIQVVTLSIGPRAVLVFEYIDGGDTMGRLQAGDWPRTDDIQVFALGVVRGLEVLHAREVVHRDIKPENIALRAGDWSRPVILDLGLGRLLDASTITYYPQPVGTAAYMAPEIIEGRPARKSCDLWSLGVILYLLVARSHPFYRDPDELLAPDDALDRLRSDPPPLPDGVKKPLRSLVGRLLSPSPYARGSAARARRDLES